MKRLKAHILRKSFMGLFIRTQKVSEFVTSIPSIIFFVLPKIIKMNEGERVAAIFVGGIFFLAAIITLVCALWFQDGRTVSMMVMSSVTSGWLFRFGLCSK